MKIHCFNEGIEFKFNHKTWLKETIKRIENEENKKFDNINFIFCSDNYIRKVNIDYLNRDYFTDTITFTYLDNNISGDIFISIDRIKENAIKYLCTEIEELKRIIIHSLLHLCGYNDENEYERGLMTEKEDYYLNII